MDERRHFVRLDTRLEVSYTLLPSGTVQQTVSKDIGGGGICLFAERTLAPGTRLQVAMRLPDRAEPVHFIAEVVWSEPYEVISQTEHRRAVEVGARFLEIAPQDRDTILQHVILSLKPPSRS